MLGGRVGGRGVHVALARDPARGGHVDDDAAAAPRLAGHVPRAGLQAVVDPLLQAGTESQCGVFLSGIRVARGKQLGQSLHNSCVSIEVNEAKEL